VCSPFAVDNPYRRTATMAKKRQWTWAPSRRLKPTVPQDVKAQVQQQAEESIEKHLKPEHVKPPPKKPRWNYLTGIHTKWHRLEYTRDSIFNLAYLRHTGKWWEVHHGLTLDKALKTIRDHEMFHPPG
jgi:hypothetical protein